MAEERLVVGLSSGVSVPVTVTLSGSSHVGNCIFTHGLGSTNPLKRGHHNDRWISMAQDIAVGLACNVLAYTARGHGKSTGWEDTCASDPDQFTWKFLASDMRAAADYYQFDRFVAGGSSMGSATSLYAAIQNPTRVRGLVLIRPPTAWQERAERRKFLLGSAEKLRERMESLGEEASRHEKIVHTVLQGTAYSDLPPVDSTEYAQIAHIPTLILTIRGDPAHPLSTAETLHGLLPRSTLFIVDSSEQAMEEFPAQIRTFLQSLPE